ncbi:MAG: YdcF family protein [Thermoguttaceae bacterium]
MKCPRLRWWLIVAVGGILILVFAMNHRTLPLLARWLDVGGPPQKADAVVLLNGGLNARPFVAAALVHGGWAPKLLLNTVAAHPSQLSGAVPPFFDINLKVLEYGGVPRDRVVCLDSAAKTTFDEAKAVADYLADHPTKRLMIVTEGPHSLRARWIFQRVLSDRPVEIMMFSGPTEEFDNENWWQSEAGFLYVVSEYFKLFFYCLRYGWLGYELVGGAAVMIFLGAWFSRRWQLLQKGVA